MRAIKRVLSGDDDVEITGVSQNFPHPYSDCTHPKRPCCECRCEACDEPAKNCQFWYDDVGSHSNATKAELKKIGEFYKKNRTPLSLDCIIGTWEDMFQTFEIKGSANGFNVGFKKVTNSYGKTLASDEGKMWQLTNDVKVANDGTLRIKVMYQDGGYQYIIFHSNTNKVIQFDAINDKNEVRTGGEMRRVGQNQIHAVQSIP